MWFTLSACIWVSLSVCMRTLLTIFWRRNELLCSALHGRFISDPFPHLNRTNTTIHCSLRMHCAAECVWPLSFQSDLTEGSNLHNPKWAAVHLSVEHCERCNGITKTFLDVREEPLRERMFAGNWVFTQICLFRNDSDRYFTSEFINYLHLPVVRKFEVEEANWLLVEAFLVSEFSC